jgi:hypothetical protein
VHTCITGHSTNPVESRTIVSYANLPLEAGNYCTIYIDGREIEGQIEKLGSVVCIVTTDEGAAMVTTRELEEWCEAPIGSTETLLKAGALPILDGVRMTLNALKTTLAKANEDAEKSRTSEDAFTRGLDAGVAIGLSNAIAALERALTK